MTCEGILVVDKPGGMTSHDVVSTARRALNTRKIGHAGTLDPMATGVLVLGVGRATRMLGYIAGHDKVYETTIVLGASTVTDDAEGEILEERDASGISDDEIDIAMRALRGAISQVPSSVSAVKVDGQRAYARVRAGEDVVLKARDVSVTEFVLLGRERIGTRVSLTARVECSTGTYVRALARDLGAALGVGGHLSQLRRTRVGGFTLDAAVPVDGITEAALMPMSTAAALAFPLLRLSPADAEHVVHGRSIAWSGGDDDDVHALLNEAGELLALGQRGAVGTRLLAVLGSAQS